MRRAASIARVVGLRGALAGVTLVLLSGTALASTTINHQFTAATINPGDISHYKITIADSSVVPLTAAAVTEVLPPQITIASPANIQNTCGFTVNAATPGTSTVFLTGGTIPAGNGSVDGQCFFQIDVTATAPGNWVALIPANTTPNATTSGYTAKESGVDIFNTTPASATLSVNTLSNPTGSKTFAPSPGIEGDPITLTITLTNPNAGATLPLTTFTDALPAGMQVSSVTAAATCTGAGAVNGAVTFTPGSVIVTGGTIGQSGTCTATAVVTVPSIVGKTQTFTNTLAAGAIGNTRGLTSPTFNRAEVVNTPITLTKTFGSPVIPAGQPSLATITINNLSTTSALTISSFVDDLTGTTLKILNTSSSPVAAPANPAVVCTGTGAANGALTAPADLLNQQITLTGAKAGSGGAGKCTITAYLTSNVDGPHVNSIPANAVTNPNGYASAGPVTATLTTNAQLTVAKSVTVANVAPGQWTRFDVTINNFSGGSVGAVTFKDVLPKNGVNQMTLFDAGSGVFSAPGPGCTLGTFNGTDALGNSTGAAPAVGDAGLLWTGGNIIAGVGLNPGVCTISIFAALPASAPTGLTFTNSIGTGTITGTVGGVGVTNTNPGSVNVVSIASAAVTKAFAPASIAQGGLSTMTITLFNRTVTALTGVSLTDNFPPGMTLASSPAATNTCGGSLQAFPNDTKLILTGGTVPARPAASQEATCVITAKVTSTTLGVSTNTIHPADFTNTQGVVIPANVTANLTVTTGLTGTKSFTPASVTSGGTSRVKITVTNSSNGSLTNVSVDDNTFSAGLTVANPANAATSCAGSPTLVVNPGATRAQLQGATLNAGGSCDFSFDAVTSGVGPWSDTIPAGKITTAEGVSNTAAVTANLAVAAAQININKSFNPVVVTGGVPSILQIDVINASAIVITGVRFTDTFPPGIVVYSVPNASTDCAGGVVTAIPGDGKFSLASATLAASGTCHVFVTTTSTKFLNLTNTIPANSIVSNQGYTNPTGTSATLSTLQGLGVLKSFSPPYVVPGQTSTLGMELVSTFDPNAPSPLTLTGVTYTDTLPNGVFIAAVPNVTTTCPGTGPGGLAAVSTANGALSGSVTVTQATIQPGTNCTITADVVSNTLGSYNNTIPANSVTTDQGIPNATAANATLFVVNKPTVSKAFSVSPINPGANSRLTVTITNGASVPITGVSLTDFLPAGVAIASTPTTGGTCTNAGAFGVVTANPGAGTLGLTGATIASGSNCTFFANVTGNTPGTYINNINANSIVSNEGLTNAGSAQATLKINGPPTVAKSFNPISIAAGATSTLTISFVNSNAAAITVTAGSPFIDTLPGNVFVAATPNVATSCTLLSVTAAPGASTITYAAGASIPIGGCTISVDTTSSTAGTYTNTIAAGQLNTSAGVNQQPAVASLAVGGALVPPTMAKSFSPSTIFVNAISHLTITLGNANAGALTLSSVFTDNLPVNVFVAAAPNIGGTCTGTVTAVAGASSITYASGATIPAGGCTIGVDVTSATAGDYTNTLPTTALVTNAPSPSLPATAGLVVQTLTPPTVLKSFNPGTINPGAISHLTISIGNSNATDATLSAAFTDALPLNVVIAAVPNAVTTCNGGTVSTGVASVTLSGGVIQAGGCTITVDVTSSTPGGPYTNSIGVNALQTSAGNNGAVATANLFVNPFQPPSVAKSFSPAVIGPGQISTLTISISNGNASPATLIADMVDTFPGVGLTIAATPNLVLSSGCVSLKVVAAAGAGSVTYQSGAVLPGNGGCTIQVNVTSSTVRTYANTIASGALQTDAGVNAVAAAANLQVLALPTIAKAFSPTSIALGSNSSLTLTLGNTNASVLTLNADFVDTLPANLVLATPATVTGTCTAASVVAAAGGSSITYKSGATIPAAGCTITVPVTSALAGVYTNVILANALSTTIGSNASGTSATLTVLQADLGITKTDGVATVVPGTATTYTIVVSNAGPSAVVNAPVADTFPGAISSATWTCAATAGSSCATASGSGPIASTVSLLSGGSATYVVTANVSASATGSLTNTATVAVPAGVSDPDPSNNSATDIDGLTPSADMQVVKLGPATIVPGQNVTYTITATNAGPSTALAVSMTDTLPAGETFVSLASPAGWSCLTPAVGSGGTVTCTVGTLAPSAPAAFTLVVKLAASTLAGTTVSNTAAVTSSTTDPTPGNNSSTTTGTAQPSADLSIVKTGPSTAVPGGPNVVFTSVITNSGPSDALGVTVADPTPAGLVFVSNTVDCTSAFPCALGTLAAGATRTIISTYQIPSGYPAPAPINNTATVSSTTSDPTPGNNSSTATVAVSGVADVAVTKTVSNPTPAVGTNVTYTITASDLGPSDATGVEITDVLPTGVTFVSATASQGTYAAGTGVWTLGGLSVSTSQTLQITVTVTQPGTIVNTATKTGENETDPDPSNNSGTAVINGPAAVADIQVQKTVDVAAPTVGSNVTFTVTVTNAGPSTATNVAVTDVLPVGLTFVSAAPSLGAYVPGTGIWTIGTLANGSTATLGLTATVTAAGTYVNVARKTAETEFDPDTGNDQSSAVVVAGGGGSPLADLSIQKNESPDPVSAGGQLTYTLLVTNHGPSGATGVTVSDTLPASVNVVSATPSQGSCSGTATVSCGLGNLASGNSATVTIVVSVTAAAVPSITNTATVTATETDPNPSDNTSTAPTTVNPIADVAIAKTVSNPAPLVSQSFTFTVTATNNGPSPATGVVVTDVLPANLGFISAAASQGNYVPGTGVWTVGTLANAQSETLVLTVSALVPGSFTNTATKTGEIEPDPNTANDSASAGGTVGVVADLTIVKTHAPATFVRGSSGTFSLIVSNVGTGPTAGLMTVSDVIPAGLAATAASGGGWTCTPGATVTCTRGDVLFPGQAWPPITVTVSVAQSAAASISNTATVGGGGDITPANDSSTDVVPVTSQADLALTKTGPPNANPGGTVAYTLVVTNNGPSDSLGVVVSDPTPANLTFVSNSGACVTAFPCSLGTILAGGSATITTTFSIPAAYTAPDPIVNSASVTAATTDPVPANNFASASTSVSADMQVVKTGPATVVPGQNVTYTITATDAGPSSAISVSLTDTLPAGTTFVSLTSPGGWSCTTPPVGAAGTVNCTDPTLVSAAPAVFTLVVNLAASTPAGTVISNTAVVASSTTDPTPGNNSSTTTGTAQPSADLSVVKTGPATAVPGGPNVVFTSVITNNGPSDAQGVSVADPTPAGLVFVSNAVDCTGAFPCALGTIAAGATRTILSTYQIPSAYPAPAPIDNVVTVSSTAPDPTPGNNSSTATVLVPTGVADVAVTKTVSNPSPAVGTNVTYTITVSDLGPSDATGVEVTDVLPAGLTFVSAAPSQGSYVPATGVWTVGPIAFGSSQTLQITVTVTQPGSIVNTATKTAGNETDPDPSNNSGSAVVNGPPAVADIQVQKTVDAPAPPVGANVTFTIVVRNAGPSAATNVDVTDLLPAGLSFVGATPSQGTYVSGTGVWTIGALANGATVTLTITANAGVAGTFVNVARKTGETELDPDTSNDQASAVVVPGGGGAALADLSIQKNDSPDPLFAGQSLTYTILVTNHGPSGATNVTITDPLPAGVTFVSAQASQGGCGGTTTVTCTLGGLAAGNSATVSIVVATTAAAVPTISNTTTVTATEPDPNPADNSATAPTTVNPIADVAIGKTVSNPAPLVTQAFSFTVTATNNGPSPATGVVVTDVLPGNLTFLSATPSQGSYVAGTGIWTVGTLANGQAVTLVLNVLATTPGAFTNTATKTGEIEPDPNPVNDSATAGGGVGIVADLTIVKTHAPGTFFRGASGTFSLIVSNVGTGPTAGLMTVSDVIPAGLAAAAASGTGWSCTPGATVTCTRSDVLLPGQAWPPITVTVSVAQSAAASISNTATVGGGGDITPANDSSTDVVPVASEADLSIVKTGPPNAIPGGPIVYTLVVTNNGPSDSQGVVVTDPTPPNLSFVSNSGACTTAFPCSLGTIPAGGTATITATFSIPAGYTAPSPIVNAASVSATTSDPTPANNSSSSSTAVAADVEVVKTVSSTVIFVGSQFTYQLVVTNHGPSAATGVSVVDALPSQVTFISATPTQGTCSGTTTVTCSLGTLPIGASATVTIAVQSASVASPVPITNSASVTANEFDPNTANNTSSVAATIGNPAIPTLSEWGWMILALALALAGVLAVRRI